jgi:CRP/FNR family transcriptional regulator, cyclic AMP receptor protein
VQAGNTVGPMMSENVVVGLLQRVPLFASLPEADLRAVAGNTRSMVKRKAATIFEEGSPADSCYVITSGRAKVVLSGGEATEVILGTVEALELVGELSLLDSSPRSAGLVALEECQLLRLPKASFQQLRANRAFEDRLVVHVTAMLRRATEQLRAIYTYDSAERVAWCLARLAIRSGRRVGATRVITPRPPHQELADMTGCSRETVTRVLAQLQKLNWISANGTSLKLNESAFKRYLDIETAASHGPETTRVV